MIFLIAYIIGVVIFYFVVSLFMKMKPKYYDEHNLIFGTLYWPATIVVFSSVYTILYIKKLLDLSIDKIAKKLNLVKEEDD